MKSNFTTAELCAQAMLLGMWYDADDHTFNKTMPHKEVHSFCADTMVPMEVVSHGGYWIIDRQREVQSGELGASDYGREEFQQFIAEINT